MSAPTRIGIVGGGQLGKMLTVAAKKMGFTVYVTDPTPHSPAGQVADRQFVGGYKDEDITRQLARESDVITVDAEFVNDEVLEDIAKEKQVYPSPKTLTIIKDKLKQKQFLRLHKLPTAPFMEVRTKADIFRAVDTFGFPFMLKARTDAYDGKGNFLIKQKTDIDKGLETLKDRPLYVEQYIHFKKELAVMVARNTKGEIAAYPVVETIHKDSICDTVIAPARISKKARRNAEQLAITTIRHLKGAGVFGIEMFLEKHDNMLVNEIAPRVHNSGHYTIEGSVTSQFEQHIRAICGLPLGNTALIPKVVVMKNILGSRYGSGVARGLEKALEIQNVSIHIYGKKETRPGRKMGHITVVGDSVEECLRRAERARKLLVI